MYRLVLVPVLLLTFYSKAQQVRPENGSTITTTSVLFEIPEVIGADVYHYSIIATDGSSTISEKDFNHVIRIEGLEFGTSYDWHVFATDWSGKDTLNKFSNQFSIAYSKDIDSSYQRFRIIRNSDSKTLDGLMFLDYSNVAITPDGTPVWFMPRNESLQNTRLRDFKLTHRGTLTYLNTLDCKEISLNGDTLWSTLGDGVVSGDDKDYYHHEFTRLSNGNYMVLGKAYIDGNLVVDGKEITKIPLSVIIEYNPQGEVVWSWSSDNYVQESDILEVGRKVALGNTFGHMNSFYYDDHSNIVYAGFRDLNCILAIDKSSGEILQSYGDKIPSDTTTQAVGFFRKQHAPIKLEGDRILLFNNNDNKEPSTVQVFSEVTESNPRSEILWEFSCDFDTIMPSAADRMGNALPLDSNHYLVNMGQVARLFEVSTEKEILWDCLPEKWDQGRQTWKPQPNYRVFHVSSLYPYYHTLSYAGVDGPSIRVTNEGSEDDRYEISIYKKKKQKARVTVVEIPNGSSTVYLLQDHYAKKRLPKQLTVEVKSLGNPDRTVKKTYQIK